MIEGLWTVKFISNIAIGGAGVIVVTAGGKVLGGDGQYTYIGSLDVVNDIVNAQVDAKLHTAISGGQSIFGSLENFTLVLSGKLGAREMVLTGRIKDKPDATINIICTKVADLT